MKEVETKGLILYSKNYKEKDKLVKIFTESFGKRMFFVKNFAKSKYNSSLQNFTELNLQATINDDGFSFISDLSDVAIYKNIAEDIFANAYVSYMLSLADAAIPDNYYDPSLYGFLEKNLQLINQGFDEQIITNIFELQVINRFGISLSFDECQVCHRKDLPMDYSFRLSGCICKNHFHEDDRRLHLDPNVIFLVNQFMSVSVEELKVISVKPEMKQKLRQFIDYLYDEYVGISLKAKKFLDGMGEWANIMK